MKRRLRSLLLLPPLATVLAGASCSATPKGALVLAISTDMQAPKDVNIVSLFITSDSAVKLDYLGRVLPDGTVALPATLAIVEPDNPGAEIRVRVTAFRDQTARVLRDVVTTVPHARTALLRLALDWIDDGDVNGTLPSLYVPGSMSGGVPVADGVTTYSPIDEPGAVLRPTCSFVDNLTMVDGRCVDATVDSSGLPDYTQAAVYGAGGIGSDGSPVDCFDVPSCFATAAPVAGLQASSCSFPLPAGADPATFNLALVTQSAGACVAPGRCLVPLAIAPGAGWTIAGGTVQLLPGVCARMAATGAQLSASTGLCPARRLSDPVCQRGTGQGADGGAPVDASGGAADAASAADVSTGPG